MKSVITQIFAVLLIILAVTTAVIWEFYFDDKINTVVVLQAVKHIPRGSRVTPSDFAPLRVRADAIPEGAVKDITTIVNSETVTTVGKGMIAVKDFFDEPGIVAGEGEMVAPIPNQWIYSLPGSLRRKDKVFIYEFPSSNIHQQAIDSYPERPVSQEQNPDKRTLYRCDSEPILKNITVAFAKDSANQEVKPSNDKFQRIDATGNISQLELILTYAQFKVLETKALDGYKFVFTYR